MLATQPKIKLQLDRSLQTNELRSIPKEKKNIHLSSLVALGHPQLKKDIRFQD